MKISKYITDLKPYRVEQSFTGNKLLLDSIQHHEATLDQRKMERQAFAKLKKIFRKRGIK
ncbi:hypothetical protein [Polynucleobacter sp.]|uniref:hypothetical protein n=1 Tax=Polynucleobacter sp. TaxID=2029855 RepID=UPI003F69F02B